MFKLNIDCILNELWILNYTREGRGKKVTQNSTRKLVLKFGKIIKTGGDCLEQQNWFLSKTCMALKKTVCGGKSLAKLCLQSWSLHWQHASPAPKIVKSVEVQLVKDADNIRRYQRISSVAINFSNDSSDTECKLCGRKFSSLPRCFRLNILLKRYQT